MTLFPWQRARVNSSNRSQQTFLILDNLSDVIRLLYQWNLCSKSGILYRSDIKIQIHIVLDKYMFHTQGSIHAKVMHICRTPKLKLIKFVLLVIMIIIVNITDLTWIKPLPYRDALAH